MRLDSYPLAVMIVILWSQAGAFARANEMSASDVTTALRSSFVAKGQATMERLQQDETQTLCTAHARHPLPPEVAEHVSALNRVTIKPPANGQYLGDFKRGEIVALSGTGLQSSDDPAKPAGGNCYACHELAATELAYGTIGPSLRRYGKLRGSSKVTLEFAWGKIYNSNAQTACSRMPRFGHHGILSEQQLQDVMAFLFDPASPVNQ